MENFNIEIRRCIWCGIGELGTKQPRKIYCSNECGWEYVKVKGWCKRHDIEFVAPKTTTLMERYERAVFLAHPWYTGDVNVMDGDERELIKTLRCEGGTLGEVAERTGHSIEFVRSVLDHEV